MAKNTVVINGKLYDAETGLPVVEASTVERPTEKIAKPASEPTKRYEIPQAHSTSTSPFIDGLKDIVSKKPKPAPKKPSSADRIRVNRPQPIHVTSVSSKQTRSQTLNRQYVHKPAAKVVNYRERATSAPVATSPMVSRFAKPAPIAVKRAPEPAMHQIDKPAVKNDLVARVEQRHVVSTRTQQKPTNSRELKEALIKEQLDKPIAKVKTPKRKRRFSIFTIATASLALVVLGGYFTYVNMPSLSVRVAASRAGVNAKYPEYNPSGYRIDGPVAFAPGQVTINYKSNSNDQHYSISQQNSNWDSSAVLENKVETETNQYQTLTQKGLTIYKYSSKASWVNGGVLYTIDGDASLSTDQVLRIVDSM